MKLWELHSSEKAGIDAGGGMEWFRTKKEAIKQMKVWGWDGKGLVEEPDGFYVDHKNTSCELLILRQIEFKTDKDSIIQLLNGTQN
jgi:hypothetical protein